MKRKKWVIGAVTAIILFFIIDVGAGIFFYKLAIERGPKDFLQGNEDLEVSADTMDTLLNGDWIKWTEKQPFETLDMTSFDGLDLKGYFLPAEEPTNKTVIFAHGYLGRASDMGLFGQYYHDELGYNIFTPDLRGHGDSEGDYYGFGWHDRLDLVDWVDQIVDKNGPDTEIVLHGLSMGAASVLMASGEDLPDNVKAIISDSAYTSVDDLFAYQLKRMFHLPRQPILAAVSLVTDFNAGYGLKEASALEQVKKTDLPILYIAGAADTFVPTEMTKELYHQTKNAELKIFPDANHGESVVMHHDAYYKTMTKFLGEHGMLSD